MWVKIRRKKDGRKLAKELIRQRNCCPPLQSSQTPQDYLFYHCSFLVVVVSGPSFVLNTYFSSGPLPRRLPSGPGRGSPEQGDPLRPGQTAGGHHGADADAGQVSGAAGTVPAGQFQKNSHATLYYNAKE